MTENEDFPIGTRVQSYDDDTGTVIEAIGPDAIHPMAGGDNVYVAWDSGVRTWACTEDLQPI